ncbi:retinoic acid binding [Desmophyllum pertusum]|uniref:Retinoic acid binding n=1 Tax=Desmophyllum pertusum TaxID=174260 RepID=A0A9X0CRT1_9CNID|nr:retinoic acid binding [Desmophyllum pertusum]
MDAQTDIKSVSDLECQLSQVSIPMEDIFPDLIREWLSAFANSNGTTSKMLLFSALASTSALIGPTTVKLFGSYEEKGNLYIVVVAPPGTGKTPACQKGCIEPIVCEMENKIETNVVIDETSTSGFFNHYLAGSTFPILCVDEAYSLLNKLTSNTKSTSQTQLSMERLCKCYDVDLWYVLKGNQGKRVGVSTAKLAMLAFTTPHQFLETVWPKIIGSKNGLSDRILLFYQKREGEMDLEEMSMQCDLLADYNVKSLGDVFKKIYIEHNGQSCSLKTSWQSVKVGISFEDLKKRVLSLPGPFTTVRRIVRSFSSTKRPSTQVCQEAMAKLQAAGIGIVVHVNQQCFF